MMQLIESQIGMATQNDDYGIFPKQWRGLIVCLSSCNDPLQRAESWLAESKWHLLTWKMEPLWPDLMKSLCQKEPCCVKNCLQFVPKVQLLPLSLQRNLLALIFQHALEISTDSLVLLRDCYGNPGSLIDQWSTFHLKQLQNKICLRKNKVTEYKASNIVTTKTKNRITMIYQTLSGDNFGKDSGTCDFQISQRHFTETTPTSFMIGSSMHSGLKNQRQGAKIPSVDAADHVKIRPSISGGQDSTTNTTIPSNTETSTQITSTDTSLHIQCTEATRSIRIKSTKTTELRNTTTIKPISTEHSGCGTGVSDAQQLPDNLKTLSVHDFSEKRSSRICSLKRHVEEDKDIGSDAIDQVKSVAAFAETDHKRPRVVISDESSLVQKQDADLSVDLKLKLEKVSHGWLHSQKSSDELGFLGNLNKTQMDIACTILNLEQLDTKHLVTVSQEIVKISDHLPITSIAMFAEHLFIKKILDLIHPPSRHLITAMIIFSKVFQRPIVQSILVPVIQSSQFTGPQCSLAISIVKDALNIENKLEFLRKIFKEHILWNAHVTTCIQLLIDSKLQLDDGDVTMITSGLHHQASHLSSCPKFAKLLHVFVKKYGNQMTSDHVTSLRKVVDLNKTFLRKAVLSAIDQL